MLLDSPHVGVDLHPDVRGRVLFRLTRESKDISNHWEGPFREVVGT
jgi:hypothetical protein